MPKDGKHVIPRSNGGWSVRQSGATRASKNFETQAEAVDYARDIAKKANTDLYVHRKDGTIRQKNVFRR
jgi:uncharacterized protein YdaT